MSSTAPTVETLCAENAELRARLEEAEDALRAIRSGEVDALVVEGDAGPQLFTLQGLDAEQIRFRSEMLAQVSDAVIALDAEERITFLNAAAERHYRVRAGGVLGRKISEIYTRHWPSPEEEAAASAQLREDGEWHGEYLQRTYDGRELHVEASVTTLRDFEGKSIGLVAAIRDISERKRAEQELREALRLLDSLLTHAPVGLGFLDRELRFLRINERLAAMNGIPAAAHIGRTVGEIVPTLADSVREVTERMLATGQPVCDHEFSGETPLAPGVTRHWNESYYPVRDDRGEIIGFGGVVEEITERKQAEEALRASEGRLDLGIRVAGLALAEVDYTTGLSHLSAEAAQQFGLGESAVALPRSQVHAVFHPDDRAELSRRIADSLDPAGKGWFAMDHRIVWPSGEVRWLRVRKQVIFQGEGSARCPVRAILASFDITDEKRTEEQLRLYEKVMINMQDVVMITEAEPIEPPGPRIIYVNPAFTKLTGYTAAEVVGKSPRILQGPKTDGLERERIRAALKAWKTVRVELTNYRKDGSEFEVEFEVVPVANEQGRFTHWVSVQRDVTERKQAEQAVARLAAIVESSHDALFSEDLDGNVTSWNRGAEEMFGYRAEELIGTSIMRLIPEERQASELERQRKIAAGEHGGTFETIRRTKDGRDFHASITISPLKDAAGKIVGSSRVVRDVTERLRGEEKLRERAEQLDLLAQCSQRLIGCDTLDHELFASIFGDIAQLIGVESVYHHRADNAERYLYLESSGGVSEDDRRLFGSMKFGEGLCGRVAETRQRLLAEDLQHSTQPGSDALRAAGAQSYAGFPLLDTRDQLLGTVAFVSRKRSQFRDGDVQMIETICAQVAVTVERARLLRELQESHQRMRLAAETTGVGIWEWNMGTNRIHWDAEMFRLYGVPPTDDGFVNYETWSRAVLPEDLALQEEVLMDTARRCGQSSREFRILRADNGECRWLQAVETVRGTGEGQDKWVVGTNLDITERILAEQKLRDADRRKDEFLATLAHELRNPMATIRSGLEVIKLTHNDPRLVAETREMMERQFTLLVALVDDLLEISRISQGKLKLRHEVVSVADFMNSAVETCRPLIVEHGHALTVDIPSQPICVDGDSHRLSQLLANIISNAAKYTPRGGRIEVKAQQDGGEIVIAVTDSGIGIAPDQLAYVFEMFAQVEKEESFGYTGLGIGLSLVKSLVEMQGGSIRAASDGPGTGSTFTVRLPVSQRTVTTRGKQTLESRTAASVRRRILVVDDNVRAARLLTIIVKSLGHEVLMASNGQEAIEVGRTFEPEIVIMDIGMPIMDGYQAARAMRGEAWGRGIVLIALTGWGQDDDKHKSTDAGFDYHLVKPVEPDTIRSILTDLVASGD